MRDSHHFRRVERLKKNFEFKEVRKNGTPYRNGVFILTICRNDKKNHRLGISISLTKLPLASKRNHLKRIIREAFRVHKTKLTNGPYDMVISLAKRVNHKINYNEAEKRLLQLMEKARIL